MCSLEGCRSTIELHPPSVDPGGADPAGGRFEAGLESKPRAVGAARLSLLGSASSAGAPRAACSMDRIGTSTGCGDRAARGCLPTTAARASRRAAELLAGGSRAPSPGAHGPRGGVVGRTGFEPVKAVPSDLQSDPFGRSGISPCGSGSGDRSWRNARHSRRLAGSGRRRSPAGAGAAHDARATVLPCPPRDRFVFPVSVRRAASAGPGGGAAGASGGTRTRNLLITNQLLCQLSHAGVQQGLPDPGGTRRSLGDLQDPGPG